VWTFFRVISPYGSYDGNRHRLLSRDPHHLQQSPRSPSTSSVVTTTQLLSKMRSNSTTITPKSSSTTPQSGLKDSEQSPDETNLTKPITESTVPETTQPILNKTSGEAQAAQILWSMYNEKMEMYKEKMEMYKEKMEAQSYAEDLKMEMYKEKMEAQSYAEDLKKQLERERSRSTIFINLLNPDHPLEDCNSAVHPPTHTLILDFGADTDDYS
jgi:hypothetical protein